MNALSEETRSQIRSTQILTTLSQIVSELVQNSLDAKSQHVEVGVNPDEWVCCVRDNGTGISRENMALIGRYNTSKSYESRTAGEESTFGFRGEALASASDVSCIEISSRTVSDRDTWSTIIQGGQQLYTGPALTWKRSDPGTTVVVREAFYNLPVRRRSHPSPARTIERVRKDIDSFALISPHVSFTLDKWLGDSDRGSNKVRLLTVPKSSSMLSAFHILYGRALAEHVDEIDISRDGMRLQGFISMEGALSKAHQFLFVNGRPSESSDLHRAIGDCFLASSFGIMLKKSALTMDTGLSASNRRSPSKSELKPVYCLNLQLPLGKVDVCLEPSKATMVFENSSAVQDFLISAVKSFLRRNNLEIDRHISSSSNTKADRRPPSPVPSSSPSKRRRRNAASDMVYLPDKDKHVEEQVAYDFDTITNDLHSDEASTSWKNPVSDELFTIDGRTRGMASAGEVDMSLESLDLAPRKYVDRLWLKKSHEGRTVLPNWLQTSYESTRESVYLPLEESIPSLAFLRPLSTANSSTTAQLLSKKSIPAYSQQNRAKAFSAQELRNSEVIGQVDKKFIACLCRQHHGSGNGSDDILILIDQHAADERVRVERFLKDICYGFLRKAPFSTGVAVSRFQTPISIVLTRQEVEILETPSASGVFKRWGFYFCPMETQTGHASSDFSQIKVDAVPEVISHKLTNSAALQELIKSLLCTDFHEYEGLNTLGSSDNGKEDQDRTLWFKALRWCPIPLLDLINSKACRGAIMFNDSLDGEQCERLVHQLSETLFPFQCAHGRPSLVPIIALNGLAHPTSREIDWSAFAKK